MVQPHLSPEIRVLSQFFMCSLMRSRQLLGILFFLLLLPYAFVLIYFISLTFYGAPYVPLGIFTFCTLAFLSLIASYFSLSALRIPDELVVALARHSLFRQQVFLVRAIMYTSFLFVAAIPSGLIAITYLISPFSPSEVEFAFFVWCAVSGLGSWVCMIEWQVLLFMRRATSIMHYMPCALFILTVVVHVFTPPMRLAGDTVYDIAVLCWLAGLLLGIWWWRRCATSDKASSFVIMIAVICIGMLLPVANLLEPAAAIANLTYWLGALSRGLYLGNPIATYQVLMPGFSDVRHIAADAMYYHAVLAAVYSSLIWMYFRMLANYIPDTYTGAST